MIAETAKLGLIAIGAAILLASCAKESGFKEQTYTGSTTEKTDKPATPADDLERMRFIPGEAVVLFSEEMTDKIENNAIDLEGLRKELGISNMERLFPYAGEFEKRTRAEGLHRFYLVDFDAAVSLSKAERAFQSMGGVECFERQHKVTDLTVNDTNFSKLWALSSAASPKTNIHVEPVWAYTMGDPNVIVNVVDTGIDLNHEDLSWNCSKENNFNFVRNNAIITAGEHGTHVAGTIAGVGNNAKGVIGIAGGDYEAGKRGVTLLSSQVFSDNGSARSFANAIKWGADHGAVISQNSWGYDYDYDKNGKLEGQELQDALAAKADNALKAAVDYFIKYAGCDSDGNQAEGAPMKGGLVVFAAGNDGIANGAPANYEPVLAVGAVKKTGLLDSYSNYGKWVDMCAPGTDIYSTIPGNRYASLSGTSMACPHVSGAAALLLSYFQKYGLTCDDLQDMLLKGANPDIVGYSGKACGPYLDVNSSFQYGIEKYIRKYNNDPIIEPDYVGDLIFRHWEEAKIPFHIYDPDGDSVEVTAKFDGRGSLEKDPVKEDTYIISVLCQLVSSTEPQTFTITAKDIYKAAAVKEFSYTVIPNRDPVANRGLDNLLLNMGGNVPEIDLTGLFSDPDEEPLKTIVTTSPSGIIDADIKDNRLSLSLTNTGLTTVSVVASDHMGKKATVEFKVLVRSGDKEIDIYPNPVVKTLHIRSGIQPEDFDVRIVTAAGATAFTGSVTCSAFNPAEIDMSKFAPGQYRIYLDSKSGKHTDMTIIKK